MVLANTTRCFHLALLIAVLVCDLAAADFVINIQTTPKDPPRSRGAVNSGSMDLDAVKYMTEMVATVPWAVEVKMEYVRPKGILWGEQVDVDVLLQNLGKEDIPIPTSRKFHSILESKSAGRRQLTLSLTLETDAGKSIPLHLDTLVGSTDEPGSLIILKPNQSVLLRTQGQSALVQPDWLTQNGTTAQIRASAKMEVFHRDEMLALTTSTVHSQNPLELEIKPRKRE